MNVAHLDIAVAPSYEKLREDDALPIRLIVKGLTALGGSEFASPQLPKTNRHLAIRSDSPDPAKARKHERLGHFHSISRPDRR